MHYVYILKSEKDNRLYIGCSSDLKNRIKNHNEGLVDATKHRRLLELIYYEAYNDKKLAREREIQLKKFGSSYQGLIKRLKLK